MDRDTVQMRQRLAMLIAEAFELESHEALKVDRLLATEVEVALDDQLSSDSRRPERRDSVEVRMKRKLSSLKQKPDPYTDKPDKTTKLQCAAPTEEDELRQMTLEQLRELGSELDCVLQHSAHQQSASSSGIVLQPQPPTSTGRKFGITLPKKPQPGVISTGKVWVCDLCSAMNADDKSTCASCSILRPRTV